MKKLFLCVAAAFCSTFAFADGADLVVKPVTITGGSGTMEVVINNANTTAFQFDVKLPAGVSATGFSLTGADASRKFEKAHYNENDNVWRFLSYDEGNAVLAEGATFNVTLAATNAAKTGVAETDNVLVVDPNGNGTEVDDASSAVTVENGVNIQIGGSGKTTLVCDQDLDFSSLTDVKAYIATGYDLSNGEVWLTRVTDVPANTPIWIKGPKSSTKFIPAGTSITYYPTNLLQGSATEAVNIPAEDDNYLCWTLYGDGSIGKQTSGVTGYPAKKAYLRLPKSVTSVVGAEKKITLSNDKFNTTLVYDADLDFTGVAGLKAYVVTGYDKAGNIWLTRVKKASVGTPLYLKGDAKGDVNVPSTEQKMYFVNMLRGETTGSVPLTTTTDDGYTNFVLYGDGNWGKIVGSANYPGGKAYLPVPTSYVPASSRGIDGHNAISENEAEVIVIKLGSTNGENDGTTSIRSIDEGQFTNDVWYNLNGQRIDTPTKKGLYIKNGKKVLVK